MHFQARSIVLPLVHGHSHSSAVSSASTEHGASTWAWDGGPSGRIPRGVYSPTLTRGLDGRAARCIWALVSQRGTHGALPLGGLRLALGLILHCVPASWVRCLHSTSSGPDPRAGLSRRWYARSRCHGQGQEVSGPRSSKSP